MSKFLKLQNKVIQWGEDRNLFNPEEGATIDSQYLKFLEELGETAKAINKNDMPEIKDGIGDTIVTLIMLAKLADYHINFVAIEPVYIEEVSVSIELSNPSDIIKSVVGCIANGDIQTAIGSLLILERYFRFDYMSSLESAYNEIKDRKGKMINRTFVKE